MAILGAQSPDSPLYAEAGRLIREAREAKHMTQGRLAAAVGLSRTSITNIERGRQKILLHALADIAEALDVPLHELLPARDTTKPSLERKLPKDVSPKEREWIAHLLKKSTSAP